MVPAAEVPRHRFPHGRSRLYGFGLGANLNRYLGFELSGDHFEIFPKVRGLGTVGEYGAFALMPQVRARYPLWHDRLVPSDRRRGITLTDFNDRKKPAFGLPVKDESNTWAATLGAGIDYFLADNISLGLEFKYLFAGDQTLKVGTPRPRSTCRTPWLGQPAPVLWS